MTRLPVINPSKQEAKVSNIVAYYRVSTQKQEKSGLGLARQRTAVAAFAAAEGPTIVAEYTETETGKGSDALDRRAQLKAANSQLPVLHGPATADLPKQLALLRVVGGHRHSLRL